MYLLLQSCVLPGTAPPNHPPTVSASDKIRKNPHLTIIFGICSGILVMIFISMLIICKCQSDQGHEKEPTTETSKYFTCHSDTSNRTINLCSSDWF